MLSDSLWAAPQGIGVLGYRHGDAHHGVESWRSFRYLDRRLEPVGPVFDLGARVVRTSRGFLALRGVTFEDTAVGAAYTALEVDDAGKTVWTIDLPRGGGFQCLGLF